MYYLTDKVRITARTCIQLSNFLLDRGSLEKMISPQIILIISTLVAHNSCATLDQFEKSDYFKIYKNLTYLQQWNLQLEAKGQIKP